MLSKKNQKVVLATAALLGAASVVEASSEGKQFRKTLNEEEMAVRRKEGERLKQQDMQMREFERK